MFHVVTLLYMDKSENILTLTFLCYLKESLEDFVFCETGRCICPSYVPGQYWPEPPGGSSVQLHYLSQPAVPAHQWDWPATQLQKCFLSLFHFQSCSCSFSQNSTVDSQNMGEINRFLFFKYFFGKKFLSNCQWIKLIPK